MPTGCPQITTVYVINQSVSPKFFTNSSTKSFKFHNRKNSRAIESHTRWNAFTFLDRKSIPGRKQEIEDILLVIGSKAFKKVPR
jgi:hypothetical protein